jgi:hypothetical protein
MSLQAARGFGGFNLPSALDIAAPAYVASFFQSRNLQGNLLGSAPPEVDYQGCQVALINKGLLPEDHVVVENILSSPS